MATTPTQLTLRELRRQGYGPVVVVEHWNSFTKRREDLLGMFDILAFKKGETLAVQTTSYANVSARVKKIAEHENIGAVREAGWTVLVHGWSQKKNSHWELKRVVDLS